MAQTYRMFIHGCIYVLFLSITGSGEDVCRKEFCQCTDSFGEINVFCDTELFDFSKVDLENVTRLTVKGRHINMTHNANVKEYPLLKTLVLEENRYKTNLTRHFLSPFINIEHLSLKECGLIDIENGALAQLLKVERLDLSGNGHLAFRSVSSGLEGFLSTELRVLNLSSIQLSDDLPSGMIPYKMLESLSSTPLHNPDMSWGRASRLEYLEVLDLSFPEFESNHIFPGFNTTCIDMPSLQKLLIPGNRLYLLSQRELRNLLINCWQLQFVDMSSNNLTRLPVDFLLNNALLTHIDMSRNELDTFTVDLSNMKNLNTLDLSFNEFKMIDQAFIANMIWNENRLSLNLDYNQFVCDCTINELLNINLSELTMTCIEGGAIKFVRRNNNTGVSALFECIKEQGITTIYIIIGSMCGCNVVSVIAVVMFWCRRKERMSDNRANPTQEPFIHIISMSETSCAKRNPKFLAFLAYSHEDKEFVCNILYPRLDKTLRELMPDHNNESILTLYDKHFLPGDDLDLICEEAILQSYVTVAVVSPSFLDSFWCSYEVKTAVHAKIPLIPLYLFKCDPSKLEGIFKYMFNHKVRMEWPAHCDWRIPSEDVNLFISQIGEVVCANVMVLKERQKIDTTESC